MRSRSLKLIAAKELLDTLRDRRTLFVAVVLPLLLYPALLLGLTQIIGATRRNLDAEQQKILFDAGGGGAELAELFRKHDLEPVEAAAPESLRGDLEALAEDGADEKARARLRAALEKEGYAGAVLCGPGLQESMARDVQAQLDLLFDPTNEASKVARGKVGKSLAEFVDSQREALRKRYPGDEARLRFAEKPVEVDDWEMASATQKGAYSFAPLLGVLIVMMALTGAFYPALDLAAGEKERGTMETLLVSPATRTEIVLGKFLAIWVIAMVTALLNLGVMGLTFSKLAGLIPGQVAFALPLTAVGAVTLILVPTTALFSAVALALSSFATSYKEGQYYMTPLFLVVSPLAMVALIPNIEMSYVLALVPVANVVLLVKTMLLGGENFGPALLATAATACYAASALGVALSMFKRESVLFRTGAGRSYDARALKAARMGLPREAHAYLLFFVVVAAMFFLSGRIESVGDAVQAFLLAQAAAIVPTVLLARRARLNVAETFSLRPLRLAFVPLILLAAACTLVVVSGLHQAFMPQGGPPAGIEKAVGYLNQIPPLLIFALLATLPPICEETLCRGFFLAAFRSRHGPAAAIAISAVLFGALHLDLQRFPATFAAGLMLGYVCFRTGSLFASILFHVVYNGIIAASMWWEELAELLGTLSWTRVGIAAFGLVVAVLLFQRGARLTPTEPPVDSVVST